MIFVEEKTVALSIESFQKHHASIVFVLLRHGQDWIRSTVLIIHPNQSPKYLEPVADEKTQCGDTKHHRQFDDGHLTGSIRWFGRSLTSGWRGSHRTSCWRLETRNVIKLFNQSIHSALAIGVVWHTVVVLSVESFFKERMSMWWEVSRTQKMSRSCTKDALLHAFAK